MRASENIDFYQNSLQFDLTERNLSIIQAIAQIHSVISKKINPTVTSG